MAPNDTLIMRAALASEPSTYREIEIEASKSLYQLAKAINDAFEFDFDHSFGFYSGLTPATMFKKAPKYELFADMGTADPGVLGVKRTKITQAFPIVGHTMLFLFDYGDEWPFCVTLKGTGKKVAKLRYPRIVASCGKAPQQYSAEDEDEAEEDGPATE